MESVVGGGLLVPTSINGPCGPLSNLDISFLQHVRVSHLCSIIVAAPPILAEFHQQDGQHLDCWIKLVSPSFHFSRVNPNISVAEICCPVDSTRGNTGQQCLLDRVTLTVPE